MRLLEQLEIKLPQIPAPELFLQRVQEQLAKRDANMRGTTAQLEVSRAEVELLNKQVRELELQLARAKATVDAQQALAAELRMLVTAQRDDTRTTP